MDKKENTNVEGTFNNTIPKFKKKPNKQQIR